jgi:CRISPR-associated protein Cas1
LTCAGLDSQIGLWHRDNYQTPSLSFDAIEPLRPKIDRLLAEMIMTGKIEPSWFETNEKYGYLAGKKGKAVLITSFNNLLEERIKMNGKITAFKNHILQMGYYIKNVIQNNSSHES